MNNLHDEFRELLDPVLEGRGDEAQHRRLQELLSGSDDLRQAYLEQVRMHAMLQWRFGTVAPQVPAPAAAPNLRLVSTTFPWKRLSLAAAILLSAAIAIGVVIRGRHHPATIANSGGWEVIDSTSTVPNGKLALNDLAINSGRLQMRSSAGAVVTISGPAHLQVLSEMRLRAISGTITVRVDPTAHGFTIDTPNAQVIDQGTEFGVKVDSTGQTDVAVFRGIVDVSTKNQIQPRRFTQGEGTHVDPKGKLTRINSIERSPAGGWSTGDSPDPKAVIRSVRDNLRDPQASKYYQIAPHGLDEDVHAYVDRVYQWNGVAKEGMPAVLVGADLVMTFNEDKHTAELEISVKLAQPATLYIFYETQFPPPAWLTNKFKDTGLKIGLDEGPPDMPHLALDTGPGQSIDRVFSVWESKVPAPGTVTLGGCDAKSMYGIAAVPLPPGTSTQPSKD